MDFDEELVMPSGKTRSMFESRIPGQSLTEDPGKYPWENPPQYTDVNDVMRMYMETILDEGTMFGLFSMLEARIPVAQIVQGMVLQGIGEGLYSPDIALLIMDELVMLIVNIAKAADIEFVHGYEREAERNMIKLAKSVEDLKGVGPEKIEAGQEVVEKELQKEDAGGLMSKPATMEE